MRTDRRSATLPYMGGGWNYRIVVYSLGSVAEVGLSGGVGRVTLAEAINRSGVPRPSAYRVFGETELDPQRAFHEELIIDITEIGPSVNVASIAAPVRGVLEQVDELGAEATPEDLSRYLRELVRLSAAAANEATFTETPIGVYPQRSTPLATIESRRQLARLKKPSLPRSFPSYANR